MGIRAEYGASLPRGTSRDYRAAANGARLTVSGVTMVMQRPPTAKGTCFITLEDEFGTIDAILRRSVYEEFEDEIRANRILEMVGRVQFIGGSKSLLADRIRGVRTHIKSKPISPGEHAATLGVPK